MENVWRLLCNARDRLDLAKGADHNMSDDTLDREGLMSTVHPQPGVHDMGTAGSL